MEWFLWILVVVVLGLAAVAGSGRLGGMPATAVRDSPRPTFPDRPLTGTDLRDVRFAVVARGYSMAQVDELLDRLAGQLEGTPTPRPEGEDAVDAGAAVPESEPSPGGSPPEDRPAG